MGMLIEQIVFYVFAAVLIISSLLVITKRNPVHCALFLVLGFFASAVLWILLEAEFLALVLILVYVGAVMTLFLFVVMMLNIDTTPQREGFVRYLPFGVIIVALIVAAMIYVIGPQHFGLAAMVPPPHEPANYSNVTELGMVLYTHYVYPFEIAAVLLLVAIIAAISLTLRKARSKKQNARDQLMAKPSDRIRIVKMPTEQKK